MHHRILSTRDWFLLSSPSLFSTTAHFLWFLQSCIPWSGILAERGKLRSNCFVLLMSPSNACPSAPLWSRIANCRHWLMAPLKHSRWPDLKSACAKSWLCEKQVEERLLNPYHLAPFWCVRWQAVAEKEAGVIALLTGLSINPSY